MQQVTRQLTARGVRRGVLAVIVFAACAAAAGSLGSGRAAAQRLCKTAIVKRVVHYCGPATARLSVFPGMTFRDGTCHRQTVNGVPLLSLGLGARSQNAATNSGLPYLALTISGPAAKPTGGGVIAYYRGKRWGGAGVSFSGTASSGSFVLRGINGSTARATGTIHC